MAVTLPPPLLAIAAFSLCPLISCVNPIDPCFESRRNEERLLRRREPAADVGLVKNWLNLGSSFPMAAGVLGEGVVGSVPDTGELGLLSEYLN